MNAIDAVSRLILPDAPEFARWPREYALGHLPRQRSLAGSGVHRHNLWVDRHVQRGIQAPSGAK